MRDGGAYGCAVPTPTLIRACRKGGRTVDYMLAVNNKLLVTKYCLANKPCHKLKHAALDDKGLANTFHVVIVLRVLYRTHCQLGMVIIRQLSQSEIYWSPQSVMVAAYTLNLHCKQQVYRDSGQKKSK